MSRKLAKSESTFSAFQDMFGFFTKTVKKFPSGTESAKYEPREGLTLSLKGNGPFRLEDLLKEYTEENFEIITEGNEVLRTDGFGYELPKSWIQIHDGPKYLMIHLKR